MTLDDKIKQEVIIDMLDNISMMSDKAIRKNMADLGQCRAVLTAIFEDHAEWTLEDGKKISTKHFSTESRENMYNVMIDGNALSSAFASWMKNSRESLIRAGRNPENLCSPGILSISHGMKVIVGWQEDYDDVDSQILSIDETMSE